jgi:hypothetical protein
MLGNWDFSEREDSKDSSNVVKNINLQISLNEGTYHGKKNG